MPRAEALYEWKWNGRRWREKPYYIVACRWCFGTFRAARSDAVSGGINCRRAQGRYNQTLAAGKPVEPGKRYRNTVRRHSRIGQHCASNDGPSTVGA